MNKDEFRIFDRVFFTGKYGLGYFGNVERIDHDGQKMLGGRIMWDPEKDACNECRECDYFLHEYWNCQGELEPCLEFLPKKDSKYKKVEIEVTNETNL